MSEYRLYGCRDCHKSFWSIISDKVSCPYCDGENVYSTGIGFVSDSDVVAIPYGDDVIDEYVCMKCKNVFYTVAGVRPYICPICGCTSLF